MTVQSVIRYIVDDDACLLYVNNYFKRLL